MALESAWYATARQALTLASHEQPTAKGLPSYVRDEFDAYLQCGILAHGFLRLGCDTCKHKMLLAFSCKKRGFCPSCARRRMAEMAAHLVDQVMPWVATRQWVVSVPIPLRYWMAASTALTAQVHTIIRSTISRITSTKAFRARKSKPARSRLCNVLAAPSMPICIIILSS